MDLVCFTLIIDDIVLPDGQTCMAQLGGGGSQSLFGFQLVSKCLQRGTKVGLAAGVGADLPDQCKAWLAEIGCDTTGLCTSELPTPRAWQVFEEDGRRTQVWRVRECDELYQQLLPRFQQLPGSFQASLHYHLGIHAGHPPMTLLKALQEAAHARGGLLSIETYTACESPLPHDQLSQLLQLTDVFSPNEAEAESIVGPGSPQQMVRALLDAGATTVLLRAGPKGVVLGHRPSGVMWKVPAVPGTAVVDVTGCGNACCGGFLAAQNAGLSLAESAKWGCVAGSIMAEWQGVPPADLQQLMEVAERKYKLLQGSEELVANGVEGLPGSNGNDNGSDSGRSSSSAGAAVVDTAPSSSRNTIVHCVHSDQQGQWVPGSSVKDSFHRVHSQLAFSSRTPRGLPLLPRCACQRALHSRRLAVGCKRICRLL